MPGVLPTRDSSHMYLKSFTFIFKTLGEARTPGTRANFSRDTYGIHLSHIFDILSITIEILSISIDIPGISIDILSISIDIPSITIKT